MTWRSGRRQAATRFRREQLISRSNKTNDDFLDRLWTVVSGVRGTQPPRPPLSIGRYAVADGFQHKSCLEKPPNIPQNRPERCVDISSPLRLAPLVRPKHINHPSSRLRQLPTRSYCKSHLMKSCTPHTAPWSASPFFRKPQFEQLHQTLLVMWRQTTDIFLFAQAEHLQSHRETYTV